MTSVMGYVDPISLAPGETVNVMVSCEGAPSYRADIVRLLCPDTAREGPGFREEVIETEANGTYPARRQEINAGSYAVVPDLGGFDGAAGFTVTAMIWPTTPKGRRQALLGTWSEESASGFLLMLDELGALALTIGNGNDAVDRVSTLVPLDSWRWYRVAASFESSSRRVRLVQEPVHEMRMAPGEMVEHVAEVSCAPGAGVGCFLLAAWHEGWDGARRRTGGHYNGRIDRPRLAGRALDGEDVVALAGNVIPPPLEDAVVAAWDFSLDISSERVSDISANGFHGETVNLPTRAVTGFNWNGEEMNWRQRPEHYGAIHFHDDDLDDAGWEADISFTVPDGLRSGVYAARLEAGDARFHVPFFVRPPRGRAPAKVAYLAATATYTAYANTRARVTGTWVELVHGRLTEVDATDLLMLARPEIGRSTYDLHNDGSGVCYSSRLRPITNMRPTGRMWNFCADLMVIDWLEHSGMPYDVITDEDLHAEGLDLIGDYQVVVTGSHPEYYSRRMLDALDGLLRQGGRMMYLGGNGFYWRIAYHRSKPGVIEVRRAEGGVRAWEARVGEYYHSFTGEYGGLWRRQGRAPNQVAGVGFIAQGFDASTYYRRTAASRDPRAAFIFEGVDEEILGDFGVMFGGSAGLEVDCWDARLGSPPHALVLASSEHHTNTFELVAEEVLVPHGASDAILNPRIRADMVFYECPDGGAVFSTGSIAYSGSLGCNDYDNNIARLTTNVLKRFADDTPFAMPAPVEAPKVESDPISLDTDLT